jgi:hypothetical protein
MDFVKEYINTMNYDDSTKERLIGSVEKLYKITVDQDQETRI